MSFSKFSTNIANFFISLYLYDCILTTAWHDLKIPTGLSSIFVGNIETLEPIKECLGLRSFSLRACSKKNEQPMINAIWLLHHSSLISPLVEEAFHAHIFYIWEYR